jgi:hypothetical protein
MVDTPESAWVLAGATERDPRYRPADTLHGHPARRWRGVRVNLDRLYPRDPDTSPRRAIFGLDMSGTTTGVLYDWVQSGSGIWYGACTFTLPYLDGRTATYHLKDQLVPAYALRPHQDDA